MKITTLFICLILSLSLADVSAQKAGKRVLISGTVLDINDEPIQNAMLLINGIKTNVLTDANGNYKVKIKPGAKTIGVVSLGNGLIEQEIGGRSEINFSFSKEKITMLEEIDPVTVDANETVNTGYNEVEHKNLTTSISKVRGDRKRSYSSIYEMLQTVPGVRVTGSTVVIHDSRNLQGIIEPLFVVDGVPVMSIDDISPVTVESIEVLKGTAAAVYGTRAAGGVILIKRRVE